MDEISPAGLTRAYEVHQGQVISYHIDPETVGIPLSPVTSIQGRDAATNAALVLQVLNGAAGPYREVVLLNAGPALVLSGRAADIAEGVQIAAEAIDSGQALNKLHDLISCSQDGIRSC
jgi:anthranilate phosphoribosyltransferase